MTPESTAAELSDLLQQTKEHLTYFQELGVTGVEPVLVFPAIESELTNADAVSSLPSQRQASDSLFDSTKPVELLTPSSETLEQIWS